MSSGAGEPPAGGDERRPGESSVVDAAAVPGIDVDRVGAWLRSAVPGLGAPLAFERIGDGRSNLTYRVRGADGGALILRRPPVGRRLRGAHDVVREHRLLAAMGAVGVPVPAVRGLCTAEEVTGAPFFLMDLVDGVVVADADAASALGPAARAAAGPALVDALATIHAADVGEAGLADLARPTPYVERQLRVWSRQWEASRTRELPAIERVAERLARTPPAERRTAVVHGDYKLENVVLGPDGAVRAILDWELCTLGDPLADLGALLTYWSEPEDPAELALQGTGAPTRVGGFARRDDLVEAYARATGDPLDGLDFHRALATWRLAIIVQGVVRRFRDAPANANADPGALDPVVDALAAEAERLAGALR